MKRNKNIYVHKDKYSNYYYFNYTPFKEIQHLLQIIDLEFKRYHVFKGE